MCVHGNTEGPAGAQRLFSHVHFLRNPKQLNHFSVHRCTVCHDVISHPPLAVLVLIDSFRVACVWGGVRVSEAVCVLAGPPLSLHGAEQVLACSPLGNLKLSK